jgi:hypothetical protein
VLTASRCLQFTFRFSALYRFAGLCRRVQWRSLQVLARNGRRLVLPLAPGQRRAGNLRLILSQRPALFVATHLAREPTRKDAQALAKVHVN